MISASQKALRERHRRWIGRLVAVKAACRAVEVAKSENTRVRARVALTEAIADLDRLPVPEEWLYSRGFPAGLPDDA